MKMTNYEIKFLQNTGFNIVRKCILFFVGFCTGAGFSYVRFDRSLSVFFFFCAFVLSVFNIKLKVESKFYKWNNRRFAYIAGFPCFFISLGFVVVSVIQRCLESTIGFSFVAVLMLFLTFYNKRFAQKIPKDES